MNGFHLTAGGKDYAERSVQMVKGVQEYYTTPGVPNQQGQHANPYISGVAYPSVPLGDYSVPKGWPGPVARRQPGQVFGPPVSLLREAPQEAKAGVGFKSDHQREGNLFYFHTDHLGSTSYLTDTAGNVSQFVCYTPYGEAIVDEHLTTYENPFKFSGKELDDITGLYDHGARNRNPITAVWYGIDELFEKYPENGPYGYCGGNPVRYFDPDGRLLKDSTGIVFRPDGTTTTDGERKPIISRIDGKRYTAEARYQNGWIYAVAPDASDQSPIPIPAMRLYSITLTDVNGNTQELIGNQTLQKSLGTYIDGLSVAERLIEGARSNCHGLAYAEGKFWINDPNVLPLINAEYNGVPRGQEQIGDVATVFRLNPQDLRRGVRTPMWNSPVHSLTIDNKYSGLYTYKTTCRGYYTEYNKTLTEDLGNLIICPIRYYRKK